VGEPGGLDVQQKADAVEVLQLRQAELGHLGRSVRAEHDEALGFEHAERLADRDHARAEALRELVEQEGLAGGEPAGEDVVPQVLHDVLAGRRMTSARRLAHGFLAIVTS
jgi:hypothetical protein